MTFRTVAARTVGFRTALIGLALVPGLVGACSSTPDGATGAVGTPTTMHDMAAMGMDGMSTDSGGAPKVQCAQHMPGDLLTAEQAMVIFDSQHVCLAYVTVTAGTGVTWHNEDSVARTVTIVDGNGAEVMSFEVPAGGAVTRSLDVAGVYNYRLSAIETFLGTVEVQEP